MAGANHRAGNALLYQPGAILAANILMQVLDYSDIRRARPISAPTQRH